MLKPMAALLAASLIGCAATQPPRPVRTMTPRESQCSAIYTMFELDLVRIQQHLSACLAGYEGNCDRATAYLASCSKPGDIFEQYSACLNEGVTANRRRGDFEMFRQMLQTITVNFHQMKLQRKTGKRTLTR